MDNIENEEEKPVEITMTYKVERIGEFFYVKEIESITPTAYYSYFKERELCLSKLKRW